MSVYVESVFSLSSICLPTYLQSILSLSLFSSSARLLRDYHLGDAEAKYLMTMREFWIVPILNPDGYVAVEVTGNKEIRKNRRPLSSSAQFLSRMKGFGLDVNYKPENEGVDLNRNYAFHFPNQLP